MMAGLSLKVTQIYENLWEGGEMSTVFEKWLPDASFILIPFVF
jgi:hypothetical protein